MQKLSKKEEAKLNKASLKISELLKQPYRLFYDEIVDELLEQYPNSEADSDIFNDFVKSATLDRMNENFDKIELWLNTGFKKCFIHEICFGLNADGDVEATYNLDRIK